MTVNYENISTPLNPVDSPYELKVVKIAYIPGDVTEDGAINIFDLLGLLKILSGMEESTPASDVDQNGAVNIFDLLELLRILSSK